MKLRTFEELVETDLRGDLSDPDFAAGYLQACLEEAQAGGDIGVFLLALRDVITATESVADVARRVGRTRASFYKSLSGKGNPQFVTVLQTLPALGIRVQLVPDDGAARERATVPRDVAPAR